MHSNNRRFGEILRNTLCALYDVCNSLQLDDSMGEVEELIQQMDARLANDDDSSSPTTTNKEQKHATKDDKTEVQGTPAGHDVAPRGKLLDRP